MAKESITSKMAANTRDNSKTITLMASDNYLTNSIISGSNAPLLKTKPLDKEQSITQMALNIRDTFKII